MPQVTIKCKWCGKDFSPTLVEDSERLVVECCCHEKECEKNPDNKNDIISVTAIYTGDGFVPVYVPTGEDKRLARILNGLLSVQCNSITRMFSNYIERRHIIGIQDLFKRLGLVE